MANFKRRKSRTAIRCIYCTPNRFGNSHKNDNKKQKETAWVDGMIKAFNANLHKSDKELGIV